MFELFKLKKKPKKREPMKVAFKDITNQHRWLGKFIEKMFNDTKVYEYGLVFKDGKMVIKTCPVCKSKPRYRDEANKGRCHCGFDIYNPKCITKLEDGK